MRRSTRFGFDRARWRGLWKVAIQEYLVSAIQNIETLDPVWKETDEGGEDCPFHDFGKGSVDLHQLLSFFSEETSAG